MSTWSYWCNGVFNTTQRATMFKQLLYLVFARASNSGRERFRLRTDYGPDGSFGDIMDVIRMYYPYVKPSNSTSRFGPSLPTKTRTEITFGDEPKVTVYAGYGAGPTELKVDEVAPSDIFECLNLNGAGTGDILASII